MKPIVILDAGHNEYVSGKEAPDKSLREWDFNNQVQYKLKKRLEKLGFEVYLTNPNPDKKNEIGLHKRCDLANNYWNKKGKPTNCLFISLHANAYGKWTSARGVEVFIAKNASSSSKNAATMICKHIYNDISKIDKGFKNRGVKVENYTVIYNTRMKCCLIEYGFYTNKSDLKLLKNNKDDFVEATIKGVCEYFKVTYVAPKKESSSSATTKETTYYRVVTNSYLDRKLADKEVSELKKLGINAFLDAFKKDNKTYLRVVAVSYTDRKNAETQLATLKKKGYDPFIAIYKK